MKGNVWKDAEGKLYLQRCPRCGNENWAPSVASGTCAWCGYAAKDSDVKEERN
jgi:ribosomal protein L37E